MYTSTNRNYPLYVWVTKSGLDSWLSLYDLQTLKIPSSFTKLHMETKHMYLLENGRVPLYKHICHFYIISTQRSCKQIYVNTCLKRRAGFSIVYTHHDRIRKHRSPLRSQCRTKNKESSSPNNTYVHK